jgi:hypothetical protein
VAKKGKSAKKRDDKSRGQKKKKTRSRVKEVAGRGGAKRSSIMQILKKKAKS